jgi:hypothetical protein
VTIAAQLPKRPIIARAAKTQGMIWMWKVVGSVISFGSGQLYVIDPVSSIGCGGLGVILLSHHFLAIKQFLTELSFPG